MKKLLLVLAIALCGCVTDEDEARDALDKAGFSNISTGDWTWFGCSKGDKQGREFTATNPVGKRVSGTVCCGILKDCTVRF